MSLFLPHTLPEPVLPSTGPPFQEGVTDTTGGDGWKGSRGVSGLMICVTAGHQELCWRTSRDVRHSGHSKLQGADGVNLLRGVKTTHAVKSFYIKNTKVGEVIIIG